MEAAALVRHVSGYLFMWVATWVVMWWLIT